METSIDIKDQIKTFEDALAKVGETAESFAARTTLDSPDEVAYKKIKVIANALNQGWKPDWKNLDEYKYYPWFDFEDDRGSGLGLSYDDCVCAYSGSGVGSRLCYKTRSLASYAGQQFAAIYAEMMVIKSEKEEKTE